MADPLLPDSAAELRLRLIELRETRRRRQAAEAVRLESAQASATTGMPAIMSPYWIRSVRTTAYCPPSDVYATNTAVETSRARTGSRPNAAVRTTCVASARSANHTISETRTSKAAARRAPGAVVPPEDLGQRDGALATNPPREEEAEREQSQRAGEVEPESGDAVRVDERGQDDGRRAARSSATRDPGPQKVSRERSAPKYEISSRPARRRQRKPMARTAAR